MTQDFSFPPSVSFHQCSILIHLCLTLYQQLSASLNNLFLGEFDVVGYDSCTVQPMNIKEVHTSETSETMYHRSCVTCHEIRNLDYIAVTTRKTRIKFSIALASKLNNWRKRTGTRPKIFGRPPVGVKNSILFFIKRY